MKSPWKCLTINQMSNSEQMYHIGRPGQPWGATERAEWFSEQAVQRSFKDQVENPLSELGQSFQLIQYGALSIDPERYLLYAAQAKSLADIAHQILFDVSDMYFFV